MLWLKLENFKNKEKRIVKEKLIVPLREVTCFEFPIPKKKYRPVVKIFVREFGDLEAEKVTVLNSADVLREINDYLF